MSISVLFVCLGNICRSPTAHGVFQKLVDDAGLNQQISVDSAGTAAWHAGKAPDARSSQHALQRGFDLSSLRARQAVTEDFERFDYIFAMDADNLHNLSAIAPAEHQGHLGLLLDFAEGVSEREVPDPYYGNGQGFERVLDLVENACTHLLANIKQSRGL